MVGVLTLLWVYYFRNFVLIKSRSNMQLIASKEDLLDKVKDDLLGKDSNSPNSSSVPWREILNKSSFW